MKSIASRIICLIMCSIMIFQLTVAGEDTVSEEKEGIRYGQPISYGTTLTAAYTERSLTSYEDGRPITLVSVSGAKNAIVQVVDINAEKIIHTFYLDFTGYTYYGCVNEAGVIYFGVGNKVVEYDPAVKTPVLIGTAPTYISGNITGLVFDEETQMVYGTVSHTGNLFGMKPETKEVSVIATLAPECISLYRADVLGDYIYVGGTYAATDGGSTHVYRVNKYTGEKTALPDPTNDQIIGGSYIYAGGKYIFANINERQNGSRAYIWNTETEKWEDKTFQFKTSGMTDIFEGKYYYLWDNCFHSIDVETLEITDYPDLQYGSHLRGNGRFIKFDHPDFPGYSFLTAQYNGNIYILNTQTSKMKRIDVVLTGSPLTRRITKVGCDDRVYIMAFKGSNGVVVNPDTGEKEYFASEQGEGIVSDYSTGKIYHGDYSGAQIFEMDTSKPYSTAAGEIGSGANPIKIGSIGYDQDRPFAMDIVGDKLVIGTLPKASKVSGALTLIDVNTYETEVYYDLIKNQTPLTVTHKDNIIYGGTTVSGGTNSVPLAKTAKVFAFDMDTRQVIKEVEISIDGINGNIGAVHGLKIGPDGMLYGAVAGAYFVMDPDTLEIIRQKVWGTSFEVNAGTNSQLWHEYMMQFDEKSGYLIIEGKIVDPETLEIICDPPFETSPQFSGLDSKGNAYFVDSDTTLYKVPVIRGTDKSYLISNLTFICRDENKIYLNGSSMDFDAYEDEGRLMVPLRLTASVLGGTVGYDEQTKTASLTNQSGAVLEYIVGDNKIAFDGVYRKFGVNMKLDGGTSYIPFRTLCDFLGKEYVEEDGIYYIFGQGEEFKLDEETREYILSEVCGNEA